MKQLTTFLYSLKNSLINPSYYADVLKAKAWFSWKYFLLWNVLVSFVVLFYVIPPIVQFEPETVSNEVVSVYPQELEIYGGADGIEINQERPYSIPFPENWIESISEEDKQQLEVNDVPLETAEDLNLVTFELDENIQNIQDFYGSNSLIVLTESTIYVLDDTDTGEVRVYAMPAFEDEFSFSYADVSGLEQKILNHPFVAQKWYVPLLSIFLVVVMIPLTIWLRIIAIAVYSVFVWILAGFFIKKLKLTYSKAFQVGLHSLTLPVLVKIILDMFDYSIGGISFLVLYMIWTMFVLSQSANTVVVKKVIKKKSSKKTVTKKIAKK